MLPVLAAEDEVQTRLRCADEPAAPATEEPSCGQPARRDSPVPEERPQRHRRKREKRRPNEKSNTFSGTEPDEKPVIGSKVVNLAFRRKLRSRGLRQELSPKCLYSRPPEEDNETGAGNQDGGRGECDGTSNNGSR